jgi:hypothetical protein
MFDFLQIIPLKIMPFFSGKPAESDNFSVDYTANRYAFYQTNLLKVLTFRGLYSGKSCLSVVQSAESFDFQKIILRKGMSFHGIIQGKF